MKHGSSVGLRPAGLHRSVRVLSSTRAARVLHPSGAAAGARTRTQPPTAEAERKPGPRQHSLCVAAKQVSSASAAQCRAPANGAAATSARLARRCAGGRKLPLLPQLPQRSRSVHPPEGALVVRLHVAARVVDPALRSSSHGCCVGAAESTRRRHRVRTRWRTFSTHGVLCSTPPMQLLARRAVGLRAACDGALCRAAPHSGRHTNPTQDRAYARSRASPHHTTTVPRRKPSAAAVF